MLQTKGNFIIDENGNDVFLRGVCIGGWMNMEDFINGYPGAEHRLAACMAETIGPQKARFWFGRLLDYMFDEDDIKFIRSCGATAVRISVNYRHFEDDSKPFVYKEEGFSRLERILDLCQKHHLYVILTLHSVQGWQNTDWHCDNSSRHSLFWQHPHFQERFVELWKEFARRFKDRSIIAGYDLMNEPNTNSPCGRFSYQYSPDWDALNKIYRQAIDAIRRIDPDHIIFLEGDGFAKYFDGLDAPFADNLVYNMHSYNPAGFGPGQYPGYIKGRLWNKETQRDFILNTQGYQFSQKYDVPLIVSEFGSVYNGPKNETTHRLAAFEDYVDIFDELGLHWTAWTYKDVGVMGLATLNPDSSYMQAVRRAMQLKEELTTDFWLTQIEHGQARRLIDKLAAVIEDAVADPETVDAESNHIFLAQTVLSGYVAHLIQPVFCKAFKGLSEQQIDEILRSFKLANCVINEGLAAIMKSQLNPSKTPQVAQIKS